MEGAAPTGAELTAKVERRLRAGGGLGHTLGAIDVFLFLAFLVPAAGGPRDQIVRGIAINAIVGVAYLGFTLWAGIRWLTEEYRPVREWLEEERPAAQADRTAALRIPLLNAKASAVLWASAAVVFGLLNMVLPGGFGPIVFVTLVLGGLTTSAVTYLMSERAMLPITSRALASGLPDRPVTPGVRARLLTAWILATGVPVLGIVALSIAQLAGSDPNYGTA